MAAPFNRSKDRGSEGTMDIKSKSEEIFSKIDALSAMILTNPLATSSPSYIEQEEIFEMALEEVTMSNSSDSINLQANNHKQEENCLTLPYEENSKVFCLGSKNPYKPKHVKMANVNMNANRSQKLKKVKPIGKKLSYEVITSSYSVPVTSTGQNKSSSDFSGKSLKSQTDKKGRQLTGIRSSSPGNKQRKSKCDKSPLKIRGKKQLKIDLTEILPTPIEDGDLTIVTPLPSSPKGTLADELKKILEGSPVKKGRPKNPLPCKKTSLADKTLSSSSVSLTTSSIQTLDNTNEVEEAGKGTGLGELDFNKESSNYDKDSDTERGDKKEKKKDQTLEVLSYCEENQRKESKQKRGKSPSKKKSTTPKKDDNWRARKPPLPVRQSISEEELNKCFKTISDSILSSDDFFDGPYSRDEQEMNTNTSNDKKMSKKTRCSPRSSSQGSLQPKSSPKLHSSIMSSWSSMGEKSHASGRKTKQENSKIDRRHVQFKASMSPRTRDGAKNSGELEMRYSNTKGYRAIGGKPSALQVEEIIHETCYDEFNEYFSGFDTLVEKAKSRKSTPSASASASASSSLYQNDNEKYGVPPTQGSSFYKEFTSAVSALKESVIKEGSCDNLQDYDSVQTRDEVKKTYLNSGKKYSKYTKNISSPRVSNNSMSSCSVLRNNMVEDSSPLMERFLMDASLNSSRASCDMDFGTSCRISSSCISKQRHQKSSCTTDSDIRRIDQSDMKTSKSDRNLLFIEKSLSDTQMAASSFPQSSYNNSYSGKTSHSLAMPEDFPYSTSEGRNRNSSQYKKSKQKEKLMREFVPGVNIPSGSASSDQIPSLPSKSTSRKSSAFSFPSSCSSKTSNSKEITSETMNEHVFETLMSNLISMKKAAKPIKEKSPYSVSVGVRRKSLPTQLNKMKHNVRGTYKDTSGRRSLPASFSPTFDREEMLTYDASSYDTSSMSSDDGYEAMLHKLSVQRNMCIQALPSVDIPPWSGATPEQPRAQKLSRLGTKMKQNVPSHSTEIQDRIRNHSTEAKRKVIKSQSNSTMSFSSTSLCSQSSAYKEGKRVYWDIPPKPPYCPRYRAASRSRSNTKCRLPYLQSSSNFSLHSKTDEDKSCKHSSSSQTVQNIKKTKGRQFMIEVLDSSDTTTDLTSKLLQYSVKKMKDRKKHFSIEKLANVEPSTGWPVVFNKRKVSVEDLIKLSPYNQCLHIAAPPTKTCKQSHHRPSRFHKIAHGKHQPQMSSSQLSCDEEQSQLYSSQTHLLARGSKSSSSTSSTSIHSDNRAWMQVIDRFPFSPTLQSPRQKSPRHKSPRQKSPRHKPSGSFFNERTDEEISRQPTPSVGIESDEESEESDPREVTPQETVREKPTPSLDVKVDEKTKQLPENIEYFENEDSEEEDVTIDSEQGIQLPGYQPKQGTYHGPSFPPRAPSFANQEPSSDVLAADLKRRDLLENKAIDWIEQELMARMLTEVYNKRQQQDPLEQIPPVVPESGGRKKEKVRKEEDEDDTISSCITEESSDITGHESLIAETLGQEGLQLFVNAGIPVDDHLVGKLVHEVIQEKLRSMVGQRTAADEEKVSKVRSPRSPESKSPRTKPRVTPRQTTPRSPSPKAMPRLYRQNTISTPVATPETTPRGSPIYTSPRGGINSPPYTPEVTPAPSEYTPISEENKSPEVESVDEASLIEDIPKDPNFFPASSRNIESHDFKQIHDTFTPTTTPPPSPPPITHIRTPSPSEIEEPPPPPTKVEMSPPVKEVVPETPPKTKESTPPESPQPEENPEYEEESISSKQDDVVDHKLPHLVRHSTPPPTKVSKGTQRSPSLTDSEISSPISSISETDHQNISEGQWLYSIRSEGEVARPHGLDQMKRTEIRDIFVKGRLKQRRTHEDDDEDTLNSAEDLLHDNQDFGTDVSHSEGEFVHRTNIPLECDPMLALLAKIDKQQPMKYLEQQLMAHQVELPHAVDKSYGEISIGQRPGIHPQDERVMLGKNERNISNTASLVLPKRGSKQRSEEQAQDALEENRAAPHANVIKVTPVREALSPERNSTPQNENSNQRRSPSPGPPQTSPQPRPRTQGGPIGRGMMMMSTNQGTRAMVGGRGPNQAQKGRFMAAESSTPIRESILEESTDFEQTNTEDPEEFKGTQTASDFNTRTMTPDRINVEALLQSRDYFGQTYSQSEVGSTTEFGQSGKSRQTRQSFEFTTSGHQSQNFESQGQFMGTRTLERSEDFGSTDGHTYGYGTGEYKFSGHYLDSLENSRDFNQSGTLERTTDSEAAMLGGRPQRSLQVTMPTMQQTETEESDGSIEDVSEFSIS